jgi:hypothetical protein
MRIDLRHPVEEPKRKSVRVISALLMGHTFLRIHTNAARA